LLERRRLYQKSLALVSSSAPAEAHHDAAKRAVLTGAARQGRIAARQENQVAQIRAVQAQGSAVLQRQKAPSVQLYLALTALGVP
jgi:hypothetical protein